MRTLSLCFILSILLAGCGASPQETADTSQPPDPSNLDPDAIAVFEQGQVTAEDLDQAILALSASQRQSLTGESDEFYRELVRELAMDEILLQEARIFGADQTPEFETQVRSLRRNAMVEAYFREHLPNLPSPTDDELRKEYQQRIDEYQRKERRLVYNLFRSLGTGGTKDDLRAELEEIRQQVLAGQSFNRLAEQHSDSESRHNRGILGWFERGQLAPQLEEVIFGLEEGIPSRPIATRDGVHLFYVDVVIEAKSFTFEEMRKTLGTQLLDRRRSEAMEEIETSLGPATDLFFPTRAELATLESRRDPKAVVLRVGDFELQQWAFEAMLANDRAQNPKAVDNRPIRLLQTIRQAERIFQHQLAQGFTLDTEVEQKLRDQAERLLALQYRQQKLGEAVDSDPESLRSFFDDNRRRFTSPLRLRIQKLSLPLGDDATSHMATLERARAELDSGDRTLESVASELAGQTETLDWMTLEQLGESEPKRLLFAGGLAADRHSPPYTTSDRIEMLKVLERQDPEPLPYEQVRGAVRGQYIERNLQRIYETLRQETLEGADFQLLEDRFRVLIESGLHPADA